MSMTADIARLCIEQLPGRVDAVALANARLCIIDGLACAIAASASEPIDMLWRTSGQGSAQAEAHVLGGRGACRADDAALVNGMMVSLLLYDDNHSEMRGHPTGPLLPAVLAVGELEAASIGEALRAFVVGYEVECQLGPVLNPSQYELGWHATATQGTIGATVAAAILLKLNPEELGRALGIAASMLGGVRRNFGTMTMSLHSGLAASAGVRSARLAKQGFTADAEIFDGEMGIGPLLSREWAPDALARSIPRWGSPFKIVEPGPVFKLLPTGRPTLAPIECALALRAAIGTGADMIEAIDCDVSYMYPRTLIHASPQTGLQGKTSLQYCIATTMVSGLPDEDCFTDAAVTRPEVRALMNRIAVRVPPELSEDQPAVRALPFDQPVTLTVRLRDGRSFSHVVLHHKGMPGNPATESDILAKFAACAKGRLPDGWGPDLASMLREDQTPVATLTRWLSRPPGLSTTIASI